MGPEESKQIEFRIIAGRLKGKTISTPDLGVTRPPLSRLRRSIFDYLNPYLREAAYLDLFCGTGSYLFEAVSRGAARAVGVERETVLADAINTQAEKLEIADALQCRCDDVMAAIGKLHAEKEHFDIIMMAPPQYLNLINTTLKMLSEKSLSRQHGLIICQHDTSETDKIDVYGMTVLQRRKYGNTTFTVLNGSRS